MRTRKKNSQLNFFKYSFFLWFDTIGIFAIITIIIDCQGKNNQRENYEGEKPDNKIYKNKL